MYVFYRQQFTELWITIKANESLGLLDVDYVEDYFGVGGQLTLHNMQDDSRIPFLITEDTDITPSIPHDAFTGFIDLDTIQNGIYRVEGRVRDTSNNYRILSDFDSPLGTESITVFELKISPFAISISLSASLMLTPSFNADVVLVLSDYSTDWLLGESIEASMSVLDKPTANLVMF